MDRHGPGEAPSRKPRRWSRLRSADDRGEGLPGPPVRSVTRLGADEIRWRPGPGGSGQADGAVPRCCGRATPAHSTGARRRPRSLATFCAPWYTAGCRQAEGNPDAGRGHSPGTKDVLVSVIVRVGSQRRSLSPGRAPARTTIDAGGCHRRYQTEITAERRAWGADEIRWQPGDRIRPTAPSPASTILPPTIIRTQQGS